MLEKKKKWSFPHEFIIIVTMAVIACILTYIIPAGEYDRTNTESGIEVVNPDIFNYVQGSPVPFWEIPMLLVQGFYDSSNLVFAILIFTGSMQIIMATGSLRALTSTVIRKFGKRQSMAVALIMFVIAVLSSPMGYNPFIAFVPVALLLSYQLGYDEIVGVAMVCLAASMGPIAGMLNPSTTGIANELAGLPLFHGFGFRLIGFFAITAATIAYLLSYAKKVKADPTYSYVYGIKPSVTSEDIQDHEEKLTKRHIAVLSVFTVSLIILVYGATKLSWGFQEMSAFFLVLGLLGAIIYGMSLNEMCNHFIDGGKLVVRAIILISLARTISIILTNGNILDTVVHFVSSGMNYIPTFLQAPGMLLMHTVINFFITSGSGQAVVTMPVMLPVADIVGMSPETAILALNYGDGFTNLIFPHSAALMAFLVLSKVPYQIWLKFIWKLVLIWYAIASIILIIAHMIGY
ncbi:YfcC family protein [Pseudogracilibacillus sp. SO10305]|uniref:YfcC family protein n=1 Tax=Pseudogracilibacillus sp. SO10305 TaxID=3098292 RepID=UPI00300DCDFA